MILALEELLLAAAGINSFLLKHDWRFCFIGGVAVQRWGNPRFTRDLDLTLLTGFGNEKKFVDVLLDELSRSLSQRHWSGLRVTSGSKSASIDGCHFP